MAHKYAYVCEHHAMIKILIIKTTLNFFFLIELILW